MDSLAGKVTQLGHVNINTTADVTLVAAKSGYRIRVLGLSIQSAAGTWQLRNATTTATVLIGPFSTPSATGLPMVMPANILGYGETISGEGLELDISASDSNTGSLTYCYVKA